MKFASHSKRLHFKSHAEKLNARRLSWLEWRREKRCGAPAKKAIVFSNGKKFRVWTEKAECAPEVFSFDDNYNETAEFVNFVRAKLANQLERNKRPAQKKKRRIAEYADYRTIKDISPTAALVLAAEFDNYRHLSNIKLHTINEHLWNDNVVFVLRSLGYHELLEMQPLNNFDPTHGSLRVLRFRSGKQAVGQTPGEIQEALAELLPDDAAQRLLYAEPYSGLFEAILNSWSWAYPFDHEFDVPVARRWWITGFADLENNLVTVAAFDKGVSIPFQLPHWKYGDRYERLKRRALARMGVSNAPDDYQFDGLSIRTAMKIARTSTGLDQHGKGLGSMQEVAERATYGRLRVLSRHGEYTWETGVGANSKYNEVAIHGTLIEWQLKL